MIDMNAEELRNMASIVNSFAAQTPVRNICELDLTITRANDYLDSNQMTNLLLMRLGENIPEYMRNEGHGNGIPKIDNKTVELCNTYAAIKRK